MPSLVAGVSAAFTAFQASAVGIFLTQNFWGRLLTTVALSALSASLTRPVASAGLTTEFTSAGGTTPTTFCLGRTATGGDMICPPMSHGAAGNTPLAYLTYVIGLGDIEGSTLDGLIIGDEAVTIGAVVHPDYGNAVA